MVDSSDKGEIRRRLLAARRSLSAPDLARAAHRVRGTAVDLVRRVGPTAVAAYAPIGDEPGGPDLPVVLASALPPPARLILPVLRDDLDLDWAAWTAGAPLAAVPRGLREPTGPRLGRSAVAQAGLVFVPALAVDRRGLRLGRGGGSYDRALSQVSPSALVVALLHDGEIVDRLPAEPHDRAVRAAITPGGGLVWLDEEPSDAADLALG